MNAILSLIHPKNKSMTTLKPFRLTLQIIMHTHPHAQLTPLKIEIALLDACPDAKRESGLVLKAYNCCLVFEMKRLQKTTPLEILLPKLAQWMVKEARVKKHEARWAIDSWAMALGFIKLNEEALIPAKKKLGKNCPEIIRLTGHTQSVKAVTFNAQGTLLASASWDGTVRLWDLNNLSQQRIFTPQIPVAGPERIITMINAVAFDFCSELFAAPNCDGGICIWDSRDGLQVRTLNGHLRVVSDLAFNNSKRLLASASHDYNVCLWDLEQGNDAIWSREFDNTAECITFSPDSTLLALATKSVDIFLLDTATGATTKVFKGHRATVRGVAFTPDGQTLASSSADQTVRLWDVKTGREVHQLSCKSKTDFTCVAISPDGKYIAAGDCKGRLYLWRINDTQLTPFMTIKGHTGIINSVAFSEDEKWLASASNDREICLYSLAEITKN